MSLVKCENCSKGMELPRAIKVAFGDGEPDVYSYYIFCSKCNTETDMDKKLTDEEEQNAINRSNRSFHSGF